MHLATKAALSRLFYLLLLFSAAVPAAFTPQPGRDYQILSAAQLQQSPLAAPDSVWVLFWYGCPACTQLEQALPEWQQAYPQFSWQHRPVVLRSGWRAHAKAFYIAEQYPDPAQLHQALYAAITESPAAFSSMQAIVDWFGEQGLAVDQVRRYYTSSDINQRLAADEARIQALAVAQVPALVIGGRYLVQASHSGSWDSFAATVRHLLALAATPED